MIPHSKFQRNLRIKSKVPEVPEGGRRQYPSQHTPSSHSIFPSPSSRSCEDQVLKCIIISFLLRQSIIHRAMPLLRIRTRTRSPYHINHINHSLSPPILYLHAASLSQVPPMQSAFFPCPKQSTYIHIHTLSRTYLQMSRTGNLLLNFYFKLSFTA